MEKNGFNLIFLAHYDISNKYNKHMCQVWEKTFSTNYYDHEWIIESTSDNYTTNKLSEILCSGNCSDETPLKSIYLKRYDSTIDFATNIISDSKDAKLFSPACADANKILCSLSANSDYKKKKTLLSYPIGQFIINILDSWDPDDRCCVITPDQMNKFLSSGWIASDNKINSRHLLHIYRNFKTMFYNCKKIIDWEIKIEKIENEINETQISSTNRWDILKNDIFHSWGTFDFYDKDLPELINVLKKYLKIASDIYPPEPKPMTVMEFLSKIKECLFQYCYPAEIKETELKIYDELKNKLSNISDESVFYPEDMEEAIKYFLGGPSKVLEEDLTINEDPIKSMYVIDGLYATSESDMAMCLADFNNYPARAKKYPWPLQDNIIKDILSKSNSNLLQYQADYTNNSPDYNRYQLFCASKCNKITFSWIKEMDNKPIQPSPYISLICKKIPNENIDIDEKPLQMKTFLLKQRNNIIWGEQNTTNIPDEAYIDLKMCHMRFIYGYILQEYPRYYSEYHESFMISALINYYKSIFTPNKIDDNIINKIEKKFDHLPNKELEKCEYHYSSIKKTEFDGEMKLLYNKLSYVNDSETNNLRFFAEYPIKLLYLIKNKLMSNMQLKNKNTVIDPKYNIHAKDVCMYCPHIEYCYSTSVILECDKTKRILPFENKEGHTTNSEQTNLFLFDHE